MKRTSLHSVTPPRRTDTRVGLMNPDFKYVNAASTDVRATFDRARRELATKGKS